MDKSITIHDVLGHLNDPEDFLRGIVGSFVESSFNKDSARVRIGTSGTGRYPHYCIEEGQQEITVTPNIRVMGFEKRFVYDCRNHRRILEDEFIGSSWGAPSSFAEVQELLGRVRGSKKIH